MLSAQTTLLGSSKTTTSLIPSVGLSRLSNGRIRRAQFGQPARRSISVNRGVRAVIGEEKSAAETLRLQMNESELISGDVVEVKAVITVRRKMKENLMEKVEEQWQSIIDGIGKGIVLQLISDEIDPATKEGKRSSETPVRGWLPRPSSDPSIDEYAADLKVPSEFGSPGAIMVTNLHNTEFYLMEIVVHGFMSGPLFFPANSWIHPRSYNPEPRIIFRNTAYLPSQTPEGLKDLRKKDMVNLRGDGKGERQKFDRIYDYDVYNDLGNPDKNSDLSRPILGGKQRPYPRRCRTGRPPCKSDPTAESRVDTPIPVYVPRDETFEEVKQATFSAGRLKGVFHNLIPALTSVLSNSDNSFECFTDIDNLYRDGVALHQEHKAGRLLVKIFGKIANFGEKILKYDLPSIILKDRFSWLRDNEFGRQTLAGVNPSSIERLMHFPIMSKLDPEIYGPPESAITKEILEKSINGMTVEEAMEEKRLFILDFHDMLLPFVKKINSLEGRKIYATRTIFFYSKSGTFRPIAIELSLPSSSPMHQKKKVFTQGHSGTATWMWKWAKAHVCSNDSGVHQLVNHWLRTHAAMETYTIAAHRQLSSMHPVFKLLHPHMRYTLEINALARQNLINGGGVIENCFTPGKFSMELSSAAYDGFWRFDMEGLPADLIRRGMAEADPSMPCGVKLIIEDYPYAADGLLVWSAIKDWVSDFVTHYYPNNESITSDGELQSWWSEIKNKGHKDKKAEPWWPKLDTSDDLQSILTTMIWTASGQHAAVNFGQYPFGGYMPNRPTLMKKLIPDEEDPEYEIFLEHPQYMLLSSLPSLLQTTKVMAVQDTLSTHAPDEEYLGQMNDLYSHWIDERKILSSYEKFSSRLVEVEEIIHKRNKDKRLTNRTGAGVPPYELLIPMSNEGVTGRGVPNSVSI